MDVIMHEASQIELTENDDIFKMNGIITNGTNNVSQIVKIEPVDIEFRNVLFKASLGFRKGMKNFSSFSLLQRSN